MILTPEIKKLFSEENQKEFSKHFKLLNKSYLNKLYPKNGEINSLDYLIKYSNLLKESILKISPNSIGKINLLAKDKLIVLLLICILIIQYNIINDLSSEWDSDLETTFSLGRKIFSNAFILELKYKINNFDDDK